MKKINYKIFESHPELKSKRLIFKEFSLDIAKEFYYLRSNTEVMKYMDTNLMENEEKAKQYINQILKDFKLKNGINFAIFLKETEKFIGYFSFWRLMLNHFRAEIGFAINPNYQGKGYMSETFEIMDDFAFNIFGLHSIEANVNPNNFKTISLLEKHGFNKEAHFKENYYFNGKFIDSLIFSKLAK